MKILNREQIRQADDYTIKNEPIPSIDLMERAAGVFVNHFCNHFNDRNLINIFCGKGNNGGDGLVAARMLLEKGYKVTTYVIHYTENSSRDFNINESRLKNVKKATIIDLNEKTDFPKISTNEIIIDALWGTGLTRAIKGFSRNIIEKINNTGATIIGLDIASGTFCDEYNPDEAKIRAKYTYSFQVPKFAFFIPENDPYIGKWDVLDIGLDKDFIAGLESDYYYLEKSDIIPILKSREHFAHKGNFGHALVMAGSFGKIGAAVLGSKSALRTGAGLVSAYVPKCGYEIIQTAVPEAMVITDKNETELTDIPDLSMFNVIGTGPGIGTSEKTAKALEKLLTNFSNPLVIDADGINIIAQNPALLKKLPENSILTPHIGEFDRLTGKSESQFQRLEKLREFSKNNKCITILKGAYSAICSPEGKIFFNSTGNPGMATGGSGDVLTGIITGFLSQYYQPIEAAILGVYIHGLAGDIAANEFSQEAMIAGDIVNCLPDTFKLLREIQKEK